MNSQPLKTGSVMPAPMLSCPPAPDQQELLDFCPHLICSLDAAGRFVYVNAASEKLWGYRPGELIGASLLDLVPEEEHRLLHRTFLRLKLEGQRSGLTRQVRCRDGARKTVSWTAEWRAEKSCVYAFVIDATGEIRRQKEVQRSEERLGWAFRLAGAGWWEWNLEENRYLASDGLYELLGFQRSTLPVITPEQFISSIHPDDLEEVSSSLRQLETTSPATGPYECKHRFIKHTGEVIHLRHFVCPVRGKSGRVEQVHGYTRDVTEQEEFEKALRDSRQKLVHTVESLGDAYFEMDRAGRITYWNKRAEAISGKSRSEVLGRCFWEMYPKTQELDIYNAFEAAQTEGRDLHLEVFSPSYALWLEFHGLPTAEGFSVHVKNIHQAKKQEERNRQLDEQLLRTRASLAHVLESMTDGFFMLNREGTVTYANDRVAAIAGMAKEKMVGRNVWEWLPDSVPTKFYTGYHKAFAENTFVSIEDYLPQFDRWFEVNAYPHGDELSVFVRDIDERKRREQELRMSNERFQFVSMATSDVVWDWNVETGELYINQSFTNVFGHELPEGPLRHLWRDNLHPEDKERVISSQAAYLQDPGAFLWEDSYRFRRKDGDFAYVTDRAVIIRGAEGRALRMVGAVKDISERRRWERRLEFMARATSELIWERSVDAPDAVLSREKLKALFGYEIPGNCLPRSFWRAQVHPEDLPRLRENRRHALEQGLDWYINDYRFKRSDGTWAFVKDRTYVIRDEDGRARSLVGAVEDVTPERLAEQALRDSENNYRQLFNHAPLPTVIYDRETLRILDVNSAAVRHYGYSREEFLSLTALDVRPAGDYPKLFSILSALEKNNRIEGGIFVHLKKGGEKIQVEVTVTTIEYRGRKAILATMKDVTEKIRLQEQLLREKVNYQKGITRAAIEAQEKERSEIGRELHDGVNQVLTSAKLYVENTRYYPDQREVFTNKGIALLQRSIHEIRRLSKALVTPTLSGISFKDTLGELVDTYRELCLFEVECTLEFEDTQNKDIHLAIYRILQEAFNNTVKYAGASLVQVLIRSCAEGLYLSYRDDGAGFDPSTVKKGLGLDNIRSRAEAYNGWMRMDSAPGRGYHLQINFPLPAAGK